MLIAWDNKGDAATVTAGSSASTHPVSNVQHPHVARHWRSASAVKSTYINLDLGSSLSCAALALLGTNLTTSATIRIRSSDTDPTATTGTEVDTGTVSAGIVTGYGGVYKTFTATASRYWRIDLEDTTVADHLEVGRLFLGPTWTPTYGHSYGYSIGWQDVSPRDVTPGGQWYISERARRRVLQLSMDFGTQADMLGSALNLGREAGSATDVLVMPETSGNYVPVLAVWGLMTELAPVVHANVNIYRQRYLVEERL